MRPSRCQGSVIARYRSQLRRDIAAQVEHHLVNIAPAPAFGRVIAFDNRMAAAVEMLGSMLAAGLVAAADMAAGAADSQMKPLPAQLEAFLAAFAAGGDLLDGAEMAAKVVGHLFGRHFLFLSGALLSQKSMDRRHHG